MGQRYRIRKTNTNYTSHNISFATKYYKHKMITYTPATGDKNALLLNTGAFLFPYYY